MKLFNEGGTFGDDHDAKGLGLVFCSFDDWQTQYENVINDSDSRQGSYQTDFTVTTIRIRHRLIQYVAKRPKRAQLKVMYSLCYILFLEDV